MTVARHKSGFSICQPRVADRRIRLDNPVLSVGEIIGFVKFLYLDKLCGKGQLTEFEKRTIIDMSKKVLGGIAAKHPKVREGVNRVMGGNVLDYEAKDILRQGISQGIEQGSLQKLIELVGRKLTKGKSVEAIAEELEEEPEIVRSICSVAAKYAPE